MDRLIAASGAGDSATIATLLAQSTVYGGLWFADKTCRQQLANAGRIKATAHDAFARCLATVNLSRSTRTSSTPGVAVLTYEPGIEIEVAFEGAGASAKVIWIGYASRRGANDNLPTVTPEALEGFRTGAPPPATTTPGSTVWLKLCLDAAGTVQAVHARAASSLEDHVAAVQSVKQWTFRPFVLDGNPSPVCSLVAYGHPATGLPVSVPDQYSDAILLAPAATEPNRVAGTKSVVPDDGEKSTVWGLPGRKVLASFAFCVDHADDIGGISMIRSSGLPRYDLKIGKAIAAWRYKPFRLDGRPISVCSLVTFIYSQR